jgi:hypothetical protein
MNNITSKLSDNFNWFMDCELPFRMALHDDVDIKILDLLKTPVFIILDNIVTNEELLFIKMNKL